MAKLSIPPISPELRQAFEPIIKQKYLDDDTKWEKTILPIFLERLKTIETLIRQSVTSNALTPSIDTLDEILRAISRIRIHLEEYFTKAAPFTIRRIAELVLLYEDSEYSLSTVAQANKYLLSLARLVCVQSKETSFRAVTLNNNQFNGSQEVNNGQVGNTLSSTEYDRYGLPKDIEYSRLMWDDAPITETIMVKDKAELLEVVAEKGLSRNDSKGMEKKESEVNENKVTSTATKNDIELEHSNALSTMKVSKSHTLEEATQPDNSVQTKEESRLNVQVQ